MNTNQRAKILAYIAASRNKHHNTILLDLVCLACAPLDKRGFISLTDLEGVFSCTRRYASMRMTALRQAGLADYDHERPHGVSGYRFHRIGPPDGGN